MPTAIEDRIVVTAALGTQVKIKSEVFRDHSPSATARSSTGGTTSTRSPSSTHSAGRLAELVEKRPGPPSRDFFTPNGTVVTAPGRQPACSRFARRAGSWPASAMPSPHTEARTPTAVRRAAQLAGLGCGSAERDVL